MTSAPRPHRVALGRPAPRRRPRFISAAFGLPKTLAVFALPALRFAARAVQRLVGPRVRAHHRACPRAVAAAPDPVVACGGGGIFFFWQLGAERALVRHRARQAEETVVESGELRAGEEWVEKDSSEGMGDVRIEMIEEDAAGVETLGLGTGAGAVFGIDVPEAQIAVGSIESGGASVGDGGAANERAENEQPELNWAGSSAGALCAVLSVCEVEPEAAVRKAHSLASEAGVYDRPLGLAGVWGGLVRQWLEALLPEDAHIRCDGRVTVHLTVFCGWFRGLRVERVNSFNSREELMECLMGSVHLPWFLDGRAWRKLVLQDRVRQVADGGLAGWCRPFRKFGVSDADCLVRAAHAPERDPDFWISHMDDKEYLESAPGFTDLLSADSAVEMINRGYLYMQETLEGKEPTPVRANLAPKSIVL